MNLHNFEERVDYEILERGQSYYEYGSIKDIEQTEQGEFRAIVSGSMDYDVVLKIDSEQNIISHYCDCPYDWGDHCKHVVAIMYHVKEHKLYEQPISESSFQQMKQQLEQLKKAELVDLVVQLCKNKHAIKLNVVEALKELKK